MVIYLYLAFIKYQILGGIKMNRASLKKIIISALIVVVIAGGGYYLYVTKFKTKTTTSSRYITEQATKGTLKVTVAGTGSVSSASTKDISIPSSGTLTGFKVSTGSAITQGTSIGSVTDSSLQTQITTDQNKLTEAKQQLTQLQQKSSTDNQSDQSKITQANDQLTQDKANPKVDQATLDKDNGAVTDAQNALSNDTLSDNNSISNQNLTIQQAQATINNDYSTLSKDNIIAPISGTFENVANANGDSVQSGKTLGTIMDLTHLELQVAIDELDISKIALGQKVDITFADVPGKKYTGTVAGIPDSGTSTNSVTTYNIAVTIDDSTGLKLGMNANASINVQSKDNVIMVPSNAIQTVNGNKYVMEPSTSSSSSASSGSGSGSASGYGGRSGSYSSGSGSSGSKSAGKLVEVQTGISNQNDVEITSGLAEGQSLLVQLPNVSTTTSSSSRSGSGGSGFGGGSGFSGGSGFGGGSGFSGGGSSRSGN
jgi:HlyD family secretion protein